MSHRKPAATTPPITGEMTQLAAKLEGVENATVAVREWNGEVIFLHEVRKGAADRSYGVQVARLAGLPDAVPFVGPETLERRRGAPFRARLGANENGFGPSPLAVEAMRAVREVSGARLFATGQGLMPFAGDPLTDLDHLSVRDRPSAQAAGVPMGFDDAFLLAEDARHARALGLLAGHKGDVSSARTEGTDAPSEVVVCVQSDTLAEGSFERMLDFAGAQLRRWDLPRESVRYLEAIPGDDHEGFDRLRDLVAPDGFIPFQAAWDGDFTFGPHQVWLTTRFHHHLVAALHGARGVALSGKPGYYDVKHQSVIEVGSNWSLVHAGQTSEPVALEELTAPAGFAEAVRAKRDEAKQLYGR